MQTILAKLDDVLGEMTDADLLAFLHEPDLESVAISIAGRSEVSHVGLLAWWRDEPMCVHAYPPTTCAVSLRRIVERQPGRIRVYQANPDGRWPEYDRMGACKWALRNTGRPYGRLGKLALAYLALVRLVLWLVGRESNPDTDDEDGGKEDDPVCSSFRAMADQYGGGVDPVNELAPGATGPGDLVRSPFYRYRFTLVP
jgi:hypothetical protein